MTLSQTETRWIVNDDQPWSPSLPHSVIQYKSLSNKTAAVTLALFTDSFRNQKFSACLPSLYSTCSSNFLHVSQSHQQSLLFNTFKGLRASPLCWMQLPCQAASKSALLHIHKYYMMGQAVMIIMYEKLNVFTSQCLATVIMSHDSLADARLPSHCHL